MVKMSQEGSVVVALLASVRMSWLLRKWGFVDFQLVTTACKYFTEVSSL